ncbi:MAG: terminase gpA endonuclease subunit, partial [Pseudomonadota bacterium]
MTRRGQPYSLPPKIRMWEWCEREITIPLETGTPWPGKYSTEPTPWVRGWYDIIEDPETFLFAIQKGAQVAATQTYMNAALFWTALDPGALLYTMDSADMMRETSKLRLKPIIDASDALRGEIKAHNDELDNMQFVFNRCFWRLVGSGSIGKISSFTHRYAIIEEPEKYKEVLGKEGSPIESILQRLKRILNSKALICCTPSTEGGFIHKYVLLGDRCFYFVPCPHCAARVILRFGGGYDAKTFPPDILTATVVFDKELSPVEAARGAYMKCPTCDKRITDAQKRDMVDRGEWLPTKKPEQTGYRSAWLGGLYPKDESATIRAFTEAFLAKKDDWPSLQVWVNQDCGELWELPPKKSISKKRIWDIRNEQRYPRGVCPTKAPCIVVATTDVQARHLVFAVWGMTRRNHWLIDHGALATYDDLDALKETVYRNADDKPLPIARVILDTGYDTMGAYWYILGRRTLPDGRETMGAPRNWIIPIKGDSGQQTRMGHEISFGKIDKFPDGKPFPGRRFFHLLHLHPRLFKDAWSYAMDGTQNVRVWFHEEIDEEYVAQVTGEVLREGKVDKFGQTDTFWVRVRRPQDQFDCGQYSMAARHVLGRQLMQLAEEPAADPPDGVVSPDNPAATEEASHG